MINYDDNNQEDLNEEVDEKKEVQDSKVNELKDSENEVINEKEEVEASTIEDVVDVEIEEDNAERETITEDVEEKIVNVDEDAENSSESELREETVKPQTRYVEPTVVVEEKKVVPPEKAKAKVKVKSSKEHSNQNRNILISILVIVLIVWNIFLTYQMFFNKAPENVENGNTGGNGMAQNVTYATTDLTKAAEKGIQKTVGISTGSGSGSGAIYKTEKKGDKTLITIITNYHVVTNNQKVDVLFANEQTLEGTVLGGDIYTDLAVVQVEADFSAEAFTLGDSSALTSGEWVLAVGSPLGLEFNGTVTEGVISGKDRVLGVDLDGNGTDDWDMLVLQTSAAINPGNSGGALINLDGELIGINSMKIANSSVEGMGFAIPINEAIPIVEQLIEKGTVERPLVGLSGRNLSDYTNAHKSYLGLPLDVDSGVVVTDVTKDGAADKAGIKQGDIITKIGTYEVENFKNFRMGLYQHQSGEEVEFEILRDGKTETVTVTLG